MWHDDNEIEKIFDRAVLDASSFPVVCPCCGDKSGHIYMNKHKECRGGIWAWCSKCGASVHMDGWIPIWWQDAPFIDEHELCGIPDYLESVAREIDEWVNRLLKSESATKIRRRLAEDEEGCICEYCGTEMEPIDDEFCTGMTCPKCGWGFVTTRFKPIYLDTTEYQIVLQPGNELKADVLRVVSSLANVNYIQTKKLIETAPVTIYKALARDIIEVIDKLNNQGINYVI